MMVRPQLKEMHMKMLKESQEGIEAKYRICVCGRSIRRNTLCPFCGRMDALPR